MSAQPKLTKGQRAFFNAVAKGTPGIFHKRVIEPIEGLPFGPAGGLVRWIGGIRLAGCNSFSSTNFALTAVGEVEAGTSRDITITTCYRGRHRTSSK